MEFSDRRHRKKDSTDLFSSFIFSVCSCAVAHTWMSKDHLSVFSLYSRGPGDRAHVSRLGGRCPCLLSWLLAFFKLLFSYVYDYMYIDVCMAQCECGGQGTISSSCSPCYNRLAGRKPSGIPLHRGLGDPVSVASSLPCVMVNTADHLYRLWNLLGDRPPV